ncbi:MAG: lytic transglycosylase domain-containing protein [Hyphomonadaceae bacterium]|nr:lytic transglycosylase domain-containing protein [Clostridia bacterium]
MYPLPYQQIIVFQAAKYQLDPLFVAAMIREESRFEPTAQSRKSAKGLMQLTDETAKEVAQKIGIQDFTHDMLYEPEINIALGCYYIASLLDTYNHDIKLALAAYNAGGGNVKKWLKDPRYSKDGKTLTDIPFQETKNYVQRVQNSRQWYKRLYPNLK